jgi:hypothetical protein
MNMALKTVMGNSGKKASSLEVGQSVEGFLIGLSETKFNFAIKLLTKDGKVETLYPNGNLNYIDEEIDGGNVVLNAYTKITRTGTRTSTKSRDQNGDFRQVPIFQVAQDTDDLVSVEDATAAKAADQAASAPEEAKDNKFANRKR